MAYVYRHIRHDKNEPFYIGIGSDKYFKRAKTKSRRNPIWKKIASKTTFDVDILFDNMPLIEAKEKEKEFISLYGRMATRTGTLANISGGGDGMFDVPEYIKKDYSIRFSGKGNPFYGKKHSEATRKMISEIQAGKKRKPLSEETRKKISEKNKGNSPPLKGKKDPKGSAARTGIKHHTYKGKIGCYDNNGVLINSFLCVRDAAYFFGEKNTNCVGRVVRGERNTYKGYSFKILNEGQPCEGLNS